MKTNDTAKRRSRTGRDRLNLQRSGCHRAHQAKYRVTPACESAEPAIPVQSALGRHRPAGLIIVCRYKRRALALYRMR